MQSNPNAIEYDQLQQNTIQYKLNNENKYNRIQPNTIKYNLIQPNTMKYNQIQFWFVVIKTLLVGNCMGAGRAILHKNDRACDNPMRILWDNSAKWLLVREAVEQHSKHPSPCEVCQQKFAFHFHECRTHTS